MHLIVGTEKPELSGVVVPASDKETLIYLVQCSHFVINCYMYYKAIFERSGTRVFCTFEKSNMHDLQVTVISYPLSTSSFLREMLQI